MALLDTWHRDYAAESIKRFELNRWDNEPSWNWLIFATECLEVTQLAQQVALEAEDQFAADVAQTVVKSRKGITQKQRFVIARALAERFGTARAVAAQVWKLTDEEIDHADA